MAELGILPRVRFLTEARGEESHPSAVDVIPWSASEGSCVQERFYFLDRKKNIFQQVVCITVHNPSLNYWKMLFL